MDEETRKELDLLWSTMRELAQAIHSISDVQVRETDTLLKLTVIFSSIKEIRELKDGRHE